MMRGSHSQRRGMVLLVVVVVVMLLSLIAYQFLLSMETEHVAVASQGDRIAAEQAALSARDLLQHLLEQPRHFRDQIGGLQDNPALFAGRAEPLMQTTASSTLPPPSGAAQKSLPPLGLIAYPTPMNDFQAGESALRGETGQRDLESSYLPGLGEQLGPPTTYGAVNESSKLHLQTLLEWETQLPGAGVKALLQLPGMDESTAEAILDWIDADDEQRPQGAESQFYATLTRPLSPRNALIFDMDELLFIKGVTPQRLFGGDSNSTLSDTQPISTELLTTLDAKPVRPWIEYLTVYGAERNESYTGEARIFLNSKELDPLYQQLAQIMPQEWAKFIILYRQFGPSDQPGEGGNTDVGSITIDPTLAAEFAIENLFDLFAVTVTIPADETGMQATVVDSPFRSESGHVELPQLLDQLTVLPETRVVGRINVQQGSRAVLAGIPGITAEHIEAIVASRDTQTELANRHHPVWLLTEGVVDLETMRVLAPYITCGGDVYRANVWGRTDDRSPMVQFETVLDASTGKAGTVYHRELAAPRDRIRFLSDAEWMTVSAFESPLSREDNVFAR